MDCKHNTQFDGKQSLLIYIELTLDFCLNSAQIRS